MTRRTGTGICQECGQDIDERGRMFCAPPKRCAEAAKLKRDRVYKRNNRPRRSSPPVDPDEFANERPMPGHVPDLQPKALSLILRRSAEFVRWMGRDLLDRLGVFCFMRGYGELDRQELLTCLLGESRVAAEEIPPDPPDEVLPALFDPLAD